MYRGTMMLGYNPFLPRRIMKRLVSA